MSNGKIYLGENSVSKFYLGTSQVSAIYKGDDKIWPQDDWIDNDIWNSNEEW